MQEYISRFFLPLLQPHQSVWMVPGMFGQNGTHGNQTAMAEQDENLLEKLKAFWDLACEEPRVTGLIPWVRHSPHSTRALSLSPSLSRSRSLPT